MEGFNEEDLVDLSEGEVLLQLQELHRQLAERRQEAAAEGEVRGAASRILFGVFFF